jgi:tRNA (guanine-N7-)-methyltransferase
LPLDESKPPALPLEPRTLFTPPPDRVWLEIGFGAGEHLAAQATAHPDIGFIGCEPFINGVAALLARIEAGALDNIRIHAGDASFVLDALSDQSLDQVFLLFPDPWPKARHAKRRFIAPVTLDALARVMRPGAILRLATDDVGYMRWSLCQITPRTDFQWLAEGPEGWRRRPADQPATRYEEKARSQGRQPVFLNFRRCQNT